MWKRSITALLAAATLAACSTGATKSAKSPVDVLAEASAALRTTSSYHVTGMLDEGFTVDLVVLPRGSAGTVTTHGVSWQETSLDGRVWFRGRRLWVATLDAARARRYANRWVRVLDAKAGFGWAGRLSHLPESIPGVVFGPQDGLHNDGLVTIEGQRVVELTTNEDIYDVRADPPYFPVRWLEKGNPGPNGAPCGITLSQFNARHAVHPPPTGLVLTAG
jgi:hypothetical protein